MEKLPMCRICLAKNVRMYVVVNKNLRELYEKLTDVPFATEDRRPILACFFCCAKLKQCFRLMTKCLEAEELFAHIMNEDYEPNTLIKLDYCSGFITTPIEQISIVDKCQTQSIAIKEELPEVCEGLLSAESIDVKEELPGVCERPDEIKEKRSDDLEPEDDGNSYLYVKDMHLQHSETESEGDVPLIVFKTEVQEALEVPKKKHRAVETTSELFTTRTKQEDTTTAKQKKNEPSNLKDFRTTLNHTSSIPDRFLKEPENCDQRSLNAVKKLKQCDICQRSFSKKSSLITHFRIHTGKKPYTCNICQLSFNQRGNLTRHNIRKHTGEKPHKCEVCQRSFSDSGSLRKHFRIHTGEKPYKCEVCQRGFIELGSLITHIRIHTGEKPYKCNFCQHSFNQRGNLTRHNIRKHTGDKPFTCDVCQRSFSEKGSLIRHIRIHTGGTV